MEKDKAQVRKQDNVQENCNVNNTFNFMVGIIVLIVAGAIVYFIVRFSKG